MTYRVARADLHRDREEILAIWKRDLPLLPLQGRHLDWGYVNNPFSEGRVWKLTGDGHTVGVGSLVIRRFTVAGSVVLAGRFGGFAVAQPHRSLGPALMLQRAVLGDCGRDGLGVIYTCAPQAIVGMTSRAGYHQVVRLTRYVKVLDIEPFLARRLPSARATRWLAWPANLALRTAAAFDWRPGLVEEIVQFDDRFDDLWKRAAPHYQVTTERTARFLQWRFREYPLDFTFTTIGVSDPLDGRLLGYGIYFMADGVANLVDLFAEDTQSALHSVLAGVTRWIRSAGATSIAVKCAGTGVLDETLRQWGFHPRPDDHPLTIMVSPPAAHANRSAWVRASQWHFLAADDFWH
jgi:hypothetical protein